LDQSQNPSRPDAVSDRFGVPGATPPPPAGVPPLGPNEESAAPATAPAPPADAPPLGPIDWLKVNGPLLLLVLAGIIWLGVRTGPMGLWKGFLVVLGVGLVIFVHELGHFLAAKWCDVHVTTFSIGFGPALPGCSFRRGETLYKIALLPLGGYVNMVGEGPEADEDENYPRSFKNKTVGQRMLIISAGVIMNVLLGCVCFIIVYRFPGERRTPAIIGRVEPGAPSWKAGVHSDMRIVDVNGRKDPFWDNLTMAVATSPAGRAIPFIFETPDHKEMAVDLTPRLEPTDDKPVIGVLPGFRLQLYPSHESDDVHPSYRLQSPAAFARVVDLRPGDRVLAASDAKGGSDLTDLPADSQKALVDLGQRMEALAGKPLTLKVRHKGDGGEETMTVPPGGFAFDDQVIGTTDPAAADPFEVTPLGPDAFPDPRARATDSTEDKPRNYFEYQSRLKQLTGRTIIVRVHRKTEHGKSAEDVSLLVPPAYHSSLGLRMTFGKVSAIRSGSPAERAGVQEGDQLTKVVLITPAGTKEFKTADVDPERLPALLAAEAAKSQGTKRVILTVVRLDKRNEEKQLPEVEWEDGWNYLEEPGMPRSPLSVPQLGLAYLVSSTVSAVEPGSPAAAAGASKGDTVTAIRFRKMPKKGEAPEWGDWDDLKDKARYDPGDACEQWAYIDSAFQFSDDHEVQLKIQEADGKVLYLPGRSAEEPTTGITAVADSSWAIADRGLIFQQDMWLQRADNTLTALVYGVQRTGEWIQQIYLNLRAVATRRVSTKSIGGPFQIVATAFVAAEDPFTLLLFLGIISVNLAVVNFLPIPVLDGGHMVFLIYEKLRGRRPSEKVQAAATIAGIVFLVALMLFVFYQDANAFGFFKWIKHLWPGR
jgi:regulator of sigma E protease